MRYHHVGIPTTERHDGETWLAEHQVNVAGFETSPFGVEWMRFEDDAPGPELVRRVPHVAFVVDDLEAALAGRDVLIAPKEISPGVRVAFVVDNGAPIEFLQFDDPAQAEADGLAPWGPPACR
jgi:hypothetical protein